MRRCTLRATAIGLASMVATALAAIPAVSAQHAAPGPHLRLIAADSTVTVPRPRNGPVFVDPGIWVASLGSALRLDVGRARYDSPVKLTQVISTQWGTTTYRALPSSLLDGWNGLKDFIRLTIRNAHGKVVDSQTVTFCPDSYGPERASPSSAAASPYPQQCGSFDPFPRGEVWGIAQGWAVDPFETNAVSPMQLGIGKYRATATITPRYVLQFGIPRQAATATVNLDVVNGNSCCGKLPADSRLHRLALPSHTYVPTMASPPREILPQLTALPSWGISTSRQSGRDMLDFGATIWVGGNSPLDVQGFRVPGTGVMRAYQYFWRGGRVIGRAEVGTMGFDNQKGHHHWHFEQFAQYRLLSADKKIAVRSNKVGFCIAPSDSVDLLLPHAAWRPSVIGLTGACGSPTALWVREYLPIGWGDTYIQSIAGQAFDITNLPNGVYYIEITANPLHKLYELAAAGNASLRKVILGGIKGNRTVRVPAFDGIDPEN
jgi:hypothetical protein